MSRNTIILISAAIVIVLAVFLGRLWFAPPPPPPARQDPSISETTSSIECNGDFQANYEVRSNLASAERYVLTAAPNANFRPNPPTLDPARLTIGAGQTRSISLSGRLVNACQRTRTTVHIESAIDPSGVNNDYDTAFGPVGAVGNTPEQEGANPNFSYTLELDCCQPAGNYTIVDSASTGVENLAFAPNQLNCAADPGMTVTVTGKLKDGENSGVVSLGLREAANADRCRLVTNVSRGEVEEDGN